MTKAKTQEAKTQEPKPTASKKEELLPVELPVSYATRQETLNALNIIRENPHETLEGKTYLTNEIIARLLLDVRYALGLDTIMDQIKAAQLAAAAEPKK